MYLPLSRFGAPEVAELIEKSEGNVISSEWLDAVLATTEGHPLFVEEVIRSLSAKLGSGDAPVRLQVPGTVRDAIRARVRKLDSATRDVLVRASVLGRELDGELLAWIIDDIDATTLPRALGAALSGRRADRDRERHVRVLSRTRARSALLRPFRR